MLALNEHLYTAYERDMEVIAGKHSFTNFDGILKTQDLFFIKKVIKQLLFSNAWEETFNLQLEIFELQKEINRLRVYLE